MIGQRPRVAAALRSEDPTSPTVRQFVVTVAGSRCSIILGQAIKYTREPLVEAGRLDYARIVAPRGERPLKSCSAALVDVYVANHVYGFWYITPQTAARFRESSLSKQTVFKQHTNAKVEPG
jgi:hypothetical protein